MGGRAGDTCGCRALTSSEHELSSLQGPPVASVSRQEGGQRAPPAPLSSSGLPCCLPRGTAERRSSPAIRELGQGTCDGESSVVTSPQAVWIPLKELPVLSGQRSWSPAKPSARLLGS